MEWSVGGVAGLENEKINEDITGWLYHIDAQFFHALDIVL
jgi:hypothetical protein